MSPHDEAGPARGVAASGADTRPRGELATSAHGWLRVQLAVVGFVGLCGALWATGEPAGPAWLQWLAAALAVLAVVLGGSAIFLVARVAYPVREPDLAAGPGDDARSRMWGRLRGGVRLSLLALLLVVVATLTAWWPDTSGGGAVEVRDAGGQAWCGRLGDAPTGAVRVNTADGPAVIPLERVAALREVDSC
ncbi:hypothetical protein H0B56_12600 [Haloechinothrix sp. YIM 98757]|uniref:Uncharacterized protein n=1 Tax=Haloechinothrix aidingensis TaxID=2752311 RepID=A0A838AAW4_9PSEU|nr:hypothetical protein [Haloechinothrix aidingensis]MBA0126382.1 hypothetical protein [Haloechinothrix aidingensis]